MAGCCTILNKVSPMAQVGDAGAEWGNVGKLREYAVLVLNTVVILSLTKGGIIGCYRSLNKWDNWKNPGRA